jgi:amino acid transporter
MPRLSSVKKFFIGEPLSTQHLQEERIPKWKALSTLSSDALSSIAYAPDEILRALLVVSVAATAYSLPIALGIVVLLAILTASYRQTIEAYPGGGGAYTVAKENLGQGAGLVAGAALMIDYTLTVSVSVASGVENMASAFPWLVAHKVAAGVMVVVLIGVMNLRGIQESASFFAFPTYFFILSVAAMIGMGLYRAAMGLPELPTAPLVQASYPAVPLILILRAYASGCAALTGVEAISNGVQIFRAPAPRNAKITLVWMSVLLGSLFVGMLALARIYQVQPHPELHQTVMSLLGRAVFGEGAAYYVLQIATALILFLAANTSYTGFPRLASLLARDRFLPRQLASLGDRLVFSNGILGLSAAAIGLLILFGGETHLLIPLYAVGVFLSFTLSQLGMVRHHLKEREPGYWRSLIINALGATATAIVLLDIAWAKLTHGAWLVIVTIPVMIWVFRKIHAHYIEVGKQLTLIGVEPQRRFERVKHTVVIPVSGIHRGVLEALRYAKSISDDVRACYVELDPATTGRMREEWKRWAADVPFVVLKSPYRSVIQPLIKYVDDVEQLRHDDVVTIVVPEFVTSKWWHTLLHNQTAFFIRAAFVFKRGKVVTSVRYHLKGL